MAKSKIRNTIHKTKLGREESKAEGGKGGGKGAKGAGKAAQAAAPESLRKQGSRGQRKRQAKRESLLAKFDFVNQATKQDIVRESGSLGNLDELAAAAEEVEKEGSKKPIFKASDFGKENKPMSRRKQAIVMEQEIGQFQEVLKVPAFQKDPLGALSQHLKNSIKRQKEELKRRLEGKMPVKQRKAGKRRSKVAKDKGAAAKGVIKKQKQPKKKKVAAKPTRSVSLPPTRSVSLPPVPESP